MRTLAIGDIHGCFSALQTLVERVPIESHDLLITLGDYVDRGPDSRKVIEWLANRAQAGAVPANSPALVALRGNHDVLMLDARESPSLFWQWMRVGGDATLASYTSQRRFAGLEQVPESHWDFLESTRPYYETATHLFVHATLLPEVPLNQQPDDVLYWEKTQHPLPHYSGKTLLCGHTAQKSGRPRIQPHAICIDTWAYGKGWLTCLEVATGEYWQANQQREFRSALLPR